MIEFDDKDIQTAFNECHFRQEYDGVDICRGMCQPCKRTIENGQCSMLVEYFNKRIRGILNETN
jgi:hypothetical protein